MYVFYTTLILYYLVMYEKGPEEDLVLMKFLKGTGIHLLFWDMIKLVMFKQEPLLIGLNHQY